jgi:hypothetical protein
MNAPSSQNARNDKTANVTGLCPGCEHAEPIVSAKGSMFILCGLSKTDSSFPKYPRLPVLQCSGYKEIKKSENDIHP